jgi:hypothetical protein
MLNRWEQEEAENVETQAAKTVMLLKFAEFSQNPDQKKLTTFQKALNKLKSISSAAADAFCTILGAPQTAEAAIPAVVYPIIANVGIFLAENPDFWNRFVSTGVSLLNLFSAIEQKRSDHALFRASPKSKPVVKSSSKHASGGGSRNPMPPNGDDEDPKKERKVDTHEDRDAFIKSRVESGEFKKLHGIRSGKPTWKSNDGTKFYQKTKEGWEIEVYDSDGNHIGVVKPSDGTFHPEMAVRGRSIDVR